MQYEPTSSFYFMEYTYVHVVNLKYIHVICYSSFIYSIEGRTPLSCAAQAGNLDIVDYLLSRHVPVSGYREVHIPEITC